MGLWNEFGPSPSNASDYDMDKISELDTSRDFKLLNIELIKRWMSLTQLFKIKFPDKNLIVICTYRSPQVQQKLYRIGRSTPGAIIVPGSVTAINKIPSRALHAVIINLGLMEWNEVAYYPLGFMARQVGLLWAGLDAKDPDYTYFSLPADVQ